MTCIVGVAKNGKVYIGADSLAYLSVDGLIESIGLDYDAPYHGLCVESFTGDYPAGLYDYEKNYKKHLSERQKSYIANKTAQLGIEMASKIHGTNFIWYTNYMDRNTESGQYAQQVKS